MRRRPGRRGLAVNRSRRRIPEISPALREILDATAADGAAYRIAVGRILHGTMATSGALRRRLTSVLASVGRLYLDYLSILENAEKLERVAVAGRSARRAARSVRRRAERENAMRNDLAAFLGTSRHWGEIFRSPAPAFASVGLRDRDDCAREIIVHLPEIYGETLKIDECIAGFYATRAADTLVDLVVGMQHLGRNHAVFLLPALEFAADPGADD